MFPFQLGVPPVAAPATRLLVIEGDSIPASLSAPRAFANLYRDAHSDLAFYNFAVAGDHISNVDARSGWSDKMPITNPSFTRWIYAPFCGGNGFLTVSNPGLAAYIQTYLDMLQGRQERGAQSHRLHAASQNDGGFQRLPSCVQHDRSRRNAVLRRALRLCRGRHDGAGFGLSRFGDIRSGLVLGWNSPDAGRSCIARADLRDGS
jgi:hypothetical protein